MAKLCVEFGTVVSKGIQEATSEKIYKGEKIEAKPQQFIVITLSGADEDINLGLISPNLVTHYIDKTQFDMLKIGEKVKIRFNYSIGEHGERRTSQGIFTLS